MTKLTYFSKKSIHMFFFLLPNSIIKISGGRELNLKDDGQKLLLSGANGIISAGYLTMNGNPIQKDLEMIEKIHLEA